jgi:hypothetical protein
MSVACAIGFLLSGALRSICSLAKLAWRFGCAVGGCMLPCGATALIDVLLPVATGACSAVSVVRSEEPAFGCTVAL